MQTRTIVLNRNETKVLSIYIEDSAKVIEKPVSSVKFSDNSHNPAYFPQKIRANKHTKHQENFHGV
jgi:hypothetical protein